jgi:hypothetical protein
MRFETAQHMSQALEPLRDRGAKRISVPPAKPSTPVSRPSTPEQIRDSLTGYRIVTSQDSEGPLARARRRRGSKPPVDSRDVPSPPPSVKVDGFSNKTPASRKQSPLAETRPIPRSDPKRKTPQVAPENAADMRSKKEEGPPDEKAPDEESRDEVDKGWDF